jgi:hypothetical protein
LPDYLKASQDGFSDPNAYPFDSRGLVFTFAFFTPKHLGEGQFCLMTVKDKDGQNFDGSKNYRLAVPANAPVNQYWSATVYNRATHGLIRDMPRSSRGSQSPGLQKNADGSVDIWFGPKAPAGKDSNWVPTNPSEQFEVLWAAPVGSRRRIGIRRARKKCAMRCRCSTRRCLISGTRAAAKRRSILFGT